MRPTLFRLASDTEDNDEALGEPRVFSSAVVDERRPSLWHENFPLCFLRSRDPPGQRQPDSRHQPVQAAGEGRDCERKQHTKRTETRRWVNVPDGTEEMLVLGVS